MAYIPIEQNPNLDLNLEAVTENTSVHADEMNIRYKQLLENDKSLAYPTFDDSGSVAGIASFTDFMNTVKSRMRIFDFFKNFKAGMQFVMHLGRAANNCTTTAEGLYLDARQGKVLMDLITKLNSDLDTKLLYSEISGIDLNTVKTAGQYGVQGGCTNLPQNTDYGSLFVLEYRRSAINHICQLIITHNLNNNSTTLGDMYFRVYNAHMSIWTSWKKVTSVFV